MRMYGLQTQFPTEDEQIMTAVRKVVDRHMVAHVAM